MIYNYFLTQNLTILLKIMKLKNFKAHLFFHFYYILKNICLNEYNFFSQK